MEYNCSVGKHSPARGCPDTTLYGTFRSAVAVSHSGRMQGVARLFL